ncbi:MAG: protease SohB [Myxococcales bacterium]|nr:protease SohB [Myxococcales bacterium]
MTEAALSLVVFVTKAFVVVISLITVAAAVARLARRQRGDGSAGELEVTRLDRELRALSDSVRDSRLGRKERRERAKKNSKDREAGDGRDVVYVIDFDGDLRATAVDELRAVVSALLGASSSGARVIVRLTSYGGTVTGYGLAAAQLARLRDGGLSMTVCVDEAAASGGYMMAAVADEIVAAPFAAIGSIGVYLPAPNFSRVLEEHGVEFQELTSGKYKRTLSTFGPNTPEGIAKTQEQLDATHALFRAHVARYRPALDIDRVSTGEVWYATDALALGLVDRIGTSDDEILRWSATHAVTHVAYAQRTSGVQSLLSRVSAHLSARTARPIGGPRARI